MNPYHYPPKSSGVANGDPITADSLEVGKAVTENAVAVTYNNADPNTNLDVSAGSLFHSTVVTKITTWVFQNPAASGKVSSFTLELTNGGLFDQTWPASVEWGSAGIPTLVAAGVDVLTFYTRDGGTTWYGAHAIKG